MLDTIYLLKIDMHLIPGLIAENIIFLNKNIYNSVKLVQFNLCFSWI